METGPKRMDTLELSDIDYQITPYSVQGDIQVLRISADT